MMVNARVPRRRRPGTRCIVTPLLAADRTHGCVGDVSGVPLVIDCRRENLRGDRRKPGSQRVSSR